ncbi:hypothetical protein N0V88_006802 [Collariella sp. IMI 366227]|nr:hypothetical protein N0V88_006802 [Collariella sp. IMI 366227]
MAEREPRPEPSRTHSAGSDSSVGPSPPPPPAPENDDLLGYLHPSADHVSSPTLAAQVDDVFKIAPQAALKLLSAGIEALVSMTGDHLPPTPPQQSPTLPHMRAMEAEKKSIVRSNSEKSLARLAAQQRGSTPTTPLAGRSPAPPPPPPPPQPEDQPIDGYCPLSTAVYVAASLYIHRLAVLERAIVVTQRNAHRLLLAGLRVAVKALEDLTYPHSRFARVGGLPVRDQRGRAVCGDVEAVA